MLDTGPASAVLLPPPAPPQATPWWAWLLAFTMFALLYVLWRYYRNTPVWRLRRLRRELLRGIRTPRHAAHALAKLLYDGRILPPTHSSPPPLTLRLRSANGKRVTNLSSRVADELKPKLDSLRFQREEPSQEQVLKLIQQIIEFH